MKEQIVVLVIDGGQIEKVIANDNIKVVEVERDAALATHLDVTVDEVRVRKVVKEIEKGGDKPDNYEMTEIFERVDNIL